MTARQRLAERLYYAHVVNPPATYEAFCQSAYFILDTLTAPTLIAEADRLDDRPGGITRLLREVWRSLHRD